MDNLGTDTDKCRKWIEYPMTPEMNWSNVDIDHVRPICMSNISDGEKLREAFNWKT